MKDQLHRGRLKFISFLLLDLLCLFISNLIAFFIYGLISVYSYTFNDHLLVIIYMLVIDVIVSLSFNTLGKVLRRSIINELIESLKQAFIGVVILSLIFFTTKQGAEFSRITVVLAYSIYFVLLVLGHIVWKKIINLIRSKKHAPSVLLITTSGYAMEGLSVVEDAGMTVSCIFVTDKTNEGVIRDIPTIVDRKDAIAFICWEMTEKIYICGPESMDVPDSFVTACQQMGISIYSSPVNNNFDFEVIKIKTALQKDDKTTGLSFFESEHDFPFKISHLYTIFESEQEFQRGFINSQQSWQLFFCPFGSIEVVVDNGKEKKRIALSDPSTGLVLLTSVWRTIEWRSSGSVLCVASSGQISSGDICKDYNSYIKYLQEKEWAATIESAEFMGDSIQ